MSVSGVGSSGANYPAPPNGGASAFGYVMLGRISDIAGALGAKASGGVSGAHGVGNSENDLLNEELQALADLSEMHMYLSAGDTQDAINAANDFLAKYQDIENNPNLDPNMNTLFSQASTYFDTSGSGSVIGFQNDSNGQDISTWWANGTKLYPISGIQTAFSALKLLKQDSSYGPSWSTYPGALIYISVIYADALSTPEGKIEGGLDSAFWGINNFGALFPYEMAAFALQQSSDANGQNTNWAQFNSIMSKMENLLKDVKPLDGAACPNFTSMVAEFSDLASKMQNPANQSWPPPQAAGCPDASYATFIRACYNMHGQIDFSILYGTLFDNMYKFWRGS